MSNKKNHSSLTAITLSILLSSTVFAGERANQQPEARFGSRWGSHAADIAYAGASYLPAAAGAYWGGLPGFAVGSNISSGLITKRQLAQRQRQTPHERAGTYRYFIPYLLNLAIITGGFPYLYSYQNMSGQNAFHTVAFALALHHLTGGGLECPAMAVALEKEMDLRKQFPNTQKLFKQYITDIIDDKTTFNKNLFDDYMQRYTARKDPNDLSVRAFIETTILENLLKKGIIELEKIGNTAGYEIFTTDQNKLDKVQSYFKALYPEPKIISQEVINYLGAKQAFPTLQITPSGALKELQY